MRILRTETVVRYDVDFSPRETRTLKQHAKWSPLISTKASEHNGNVTIGRATLTKRQINDVCDVLGINGREFMAMPRVGGAYAALEPVPRESKTRRRSRS